MTERIREKNILKGQRLAELIMKKFGSRQAFLEKLQLEGSNVGKEMLSMYISGKKNISDSNVDLFAYILDVDMDYLNGDYRLCRSYEEYEKFVKQIGIISDIPFGKYDSFFIHAGLYLSAHTDITDENAEYNLYRTSDRTSKRFTTSGMETFYKKIIDIINDEYDKYESIYEETEHIPSSNNMDKIKEVRKEADKLKRTSNQVKKGVKR